jgi:hypothetical protein
LESSYFGLVAGGLTDVTIIIGMGRHCVEKSTCCGTKSDPESPDDVEGLCSCRKLGTSGAARESLRFLCVAMTLGGAGTTKESRRTITFDVESPDPRRDPLRAVMVTSLDVVMAGIFS